MTVLIIVTKGGGMTVHLKSSEIQGIPLMVLDMKKAKLTMGYASFDGYVCVCIDCFAYSIYIKKLVSNNERI